MKRFRLITINIFLVIAVAVLLGACIRKGEVLVPGTYESGNTIYEFASDGTVKFTDDGVVKFGYYTAVDGELTIKYDGETVKWDYSSDSDELQLFKPGLIFGTVYKMTAEGKESIDGWIEPETIGEAETTTQETTTEQTTAAETSALETTTQETTAEQTTAETTTAETTAAPQTQETEKASEETTAAEEYITQAPFVNRINGTVELGATVTFGSYEQDNNTADGTEAIEWTVLRIEGNKALLLSTKGLDCIQYDYSGDEVTWETCSLRAWLNSEFVYSAFTDEELANIEVTSATADTNPDYSYKDNGNSCDDWLFLLSTNQAYIYRSCFNGVCEATEYAKAQGASVSDGAGWWWLRTTGGNDNSFAVVAPSGEIDYEGAYKWDAENLVRPAVWVRFSE